MEFPDLGKHCSEKTCKQLDFLPVTCDACKQDFCKDHFTFAAHECPFAFKKDIQVPVCPLCNSPVPVKKGELPDVVVGEHMDQDCKSNPGRSHEKIFTYRCSKKDAREKRCCRWSAASVTVTSASDTDTLWTTAASKEAAPTSRAGWKVRR